MIIGYVGPTYQSYIAHTENDYLITRSDDGVVKVIVLVKRRWDIKR